MEEKKRAFTPIQKTLALVFGFLAIVPLILITVLSYFHSSQSLKQAAIEQLSQSSIATERFINNWFEYRLMDVSTIAQARTTAKFTESLITGLEQSKADIDQYVHSNDWQQRVATWHSDIRTLSEQYDYIYDVFLIDRKGNILFTLAREDDLGTNLISGPHRNTLLAQGVKTSLRNVEVQFSGLERYSPSNNIIAGFFTTPIINEDGEHLGICAVQIRLDRIYDYFNLTDEHLHHYLLDSHGTLLSPIDNNLDGVLSRKITTARYESWRLSHNLSQTNYQHEEGEGSMRYEGPDSVDVIGIHRNINVLNQQWVLISEMPTEQAFSKAWWLVKTSFFIVLPLLLGLIVAVIWVSKRLSCPITELVRITKEVAKGHIDRQIEFTDNNEFKELAEAFNQMLSARQQYEQELHASSESVRQALSELEELKYALNEHAIVSITDLEGKITYVNDKFCELMGYEAHELLGQQHHLVNSGTHEPQFFQQLYQTISSGNVWRNEVCNRSKQGQLSWLDTTIVPFKGKDGKPIRYIVIRSDITERKQAEIALQKSERLHRVMFEGAQDAHFILDEGRCIECNQATLRIFKLSKEEMLGKTLADLAPTYQADGQPSAQSADEKLTKALAEGHQHFEWLNQTATAQEFWSDINVSVIPYEQREVLLVSLRDISTKKQAEEMQLKTDSLMRGLFELSPIGIALNDFETGAYVKTNDALIEPSGYSKEEFESLSYWDLTPSYYEQQEQIQLQALREKGRYGPYEKEYIRKDGSHYPVLLNGMLVDDPSSNKKMIWSIIEDITERKLVEQDLIKAKEQAEAAVLAKSEFLASMSHEIRTPMNGVIGMLGLLNKSNLTEDQHRKASIAQSSAQSLLTLINDILDYSKVEAGKLELEDLCFNLPQMLGDFAEGMAHQAEDKNIELILDVSQVKQTMVCGDPSRIRQILTNLVSNSIKFTEQGEVLITASLIEHSAEQWALHCSVQDTGIGIAQEKQTNLFDSFSQVDASTTRKYGGTGLGLAISKKLCVLMGGDIQVHSRVGEGSCFNINVLVNKSKDSEIWKPSFDIQQLNILVVDDNRSHRNCISKQLQAWGAKVLEAESATQAIEMCTQKSAPKSFDIAFIDMHMPDMGGIELGRTLKTEQQSQNIKLVLMTPMSQQGDFYFFTEMGFDAYFPKPATSSNIFDALQVVQQAIGQTTEGANSDEERAESLNKNPKPWPEDTRLLLVEDNHINQMVAKGILFDFGLKTDVASNGVEALALLSSASKQYSLILMDCQMPEMDGYTCTEQIRQAQGGAAHIDVPIVAMTANAMSGDKEKCLAAGMNDYLAKPIEPELLKQKLELYLLNQHNAEPEQEAQASEELDHLLIWNKEAALKRTLGKESLLNKLTALFIEESAEQMAALLSAVEAKDLEQVRHLAHTLKGTAANLGAELLQHYCAQLEFAAREEKPETFTELMPTIESQNKAFIQSLKSPEGEEAKEGDAKEGEASSLDVSALLTELKNLEQLLQRGVFIEVDSLSSLQQDYEDEELKLLLESLLAQVAGFDFRAAMLSVKQLEALLTQDGREG